MLTYQSQHASKETGDLIGWQRRVSGTCTTFGLAIIKACVLPRRDASRQVYERVIVWFDRLRLR
jgi:hypothetical protein